MTPRHRPFPASLVARIRRVAPAGRRAPALARGRLPALRRGRLPMLGRPSAVALSALASLAVTLSAQPSPLAADQATNPRATVTDPRPTVTDVSGRTVTITDGPQRIVIDDARYLIALSLLLEDPAAVVAGWPHDGHRLGAGTYERYRERFPRLDELKRVSSSAGSFSIEQTLAAEPTLAVFSLGRGPTERQVEMLAQAGVPSVFLDFFMDPLENVDRSLTILGDIVGRPDRAADFVALRTSRRARIRDTLASAEIDAPLVFFETHAGMSQECCNSPGQGNAGVYIDFVGGHNIGADVLPGPTGRLSLEYVLERDPDIYVATGGPHLARAGGLVLGDGYAREDASTALARTVDRPGIGRLGAVAAGRAHGMSHHLLNSPLDIVVVELLAQWIHPELFPEIDPAATLESINRDFLAVDVDGTHWVSLSEKATEALPESRNPRP